MIHLSGTARSLRGIIEQHAERVGCNLKDLTVMNRKNDPYRMDTPAQHRDAKWFAGAWESSRARRPLHLRGIHYALVSMSPTLVMPNGQPYINSAECWAWLELTSGVARWLNYVAFEDIIDERNDKPMTADYSVDGDPWIDISDSDFSLGLLGSVSRSYGRFDYGLPRVTTGSFYAAQPYRLVLIGEKSSLSHVLDPIARRYGCELILPTGNISNTLLQGLVRRAAADGRPCRVFYFSDFDPVGDHMPIEVSRKIQAFVDRDYTDIDLQTRRCALTVEQVIELELPETPLKEEEKKADRWREKWGREQTEIDALATLRPDVLRQIVVNAIEPYHDWSLPSRVMQAERAVTLTVEQALAAAVAARSDEINAIKQRVAALDAPIDELNEQIAQINAEQAKERDALAVDGTALKQAIAEEAREALPELDLPEPDVGGDITAPLFDSRGDWLEQTQKLIKERT